MSTPGKHIVVCGAGIIGLCCAHFLVTRGHTVTVVERDGELRDGCSFGNAGMIVPSHFTPLAAPGMVALGLKWMLNPRSPFYIRPRFDRELLGWGCEFIRASTAAHVHRASPVLRDLHLASRRLYEDLARELGGAFGLTQRGLLMLCRTEKGFEEERKVADRARALGLTAAALTPSAAASLDPGIRMAIAGAVYFPGDAHLTPERLMAVLHRSLVRRGVDFRWNTAISAWQTRGERVIAATASQEAIEADEFILATGSWTSALARGLGLALPLQPGKGYSVTLAKPRQQPQLCSILTEARVAVTPMETGLRVGGTMELSGMDESIQPARVQGILHAVADYFPELRVDDFTQLPVWHGLRPCAPDGLPYLGRSRRYANLTVATGHAMMGLSLAPITGRLVSEIVSGQQPSVDLSLLHPDRFS